MSRRVAVPILMMLSAGVAAASTGSRIQLAAETTRVAVGQEIAVSVVVEKAPPIYGTDVEVAFDPARLEVVDADPRRPGLQVAPGTFIDPGKSFTLQDSVDNDTGRVDYALTLLNPAPDAEGDGALARIVFRGKAPGETKVYVRQGQFGTRKGEVLSPGLGGLALTVLEAGEKPPTALATQVRAVTRKVAAFVAHPTDPGNRGGLIALAALVVPVALLMGFWMGRRRQRS